MKKTAIILLIIALCGSVFAQKSIDLLTLSGSYGFPQNYESQVSEQATEYLGNVGITLPVVLSDASVIFNNLNYYYSTVQTDAVFGDTVVNPIVLHGFILRTGIVHKIDDSRAFQILLVPRLMSDFNNNIGESFQIGGVAMYEKRFRKDLMMRFGLMFNNEFFGPYLVPVIHVDWNITPKLSAVGMLPVYLKVKYHMSEQMEAGISFFGLTTSYRLGDTKYEDDYMVSETIDLGLYGRYNIAGNIHVEARFIYSLGRNYAQYHDDEKVNFSVPLKGFGDERTQQNISMPGGPLINLRLIYSLPLDE
ncbi:DUF6268 family outer membrane beta-barrel protein [Bacteroidota bacterium]